jgi:hypothetical protein
MLLVLGLGLRFLDFFLLVLPILGFALSSVIFCLDFDPFFFLLLILCWVFFIYLFIYLFVDIQGP